MPSEVLPFVIEELQKHLFVSKTTLGQKEKENAALKEQAKQLEAHWSEYEAKMRTMEETWEKQIASLQVSSRVRLIILETVSSVAETFFPSCYLSCALSW